MATDILGSLNASSGASANTSASRTRANAWADYLGATGIPHEVANEGPRFGHYFMVIEAARRGDGIAVVPKVLVEDDLASGRLVTLRGCGSGRTILISRSPATHPLTLRPSARP